MHVRGVEFFKGRHIPVYQRKEPESTIELLRERSAIFVWEVGTSLLAIGIAGFAGRTLLRFRLRSDSTR
jgi:hypothetical protein